MIMRTAVPRVALSSVFPRRATHCNWAARRETAAKTKKGGETVCGGEKRTSRMRSNRYAKTLHETGARSRRDRAACVVGGARASRVRTVLLPVGGRVRQRSLPRQRGTGRVVAAAAATAAATATAADAAAATAPKSSLE